MKPFVTASPSDCGAHAATPFLHARWRPRGHSHLPRNPRLTSGHGRWALTFLWVASPL